MDPKVFINAVLEPLGYKLIKKPKFRKETAAQQNSKQGINEFFGTDDKVKDYLAPGRMKFYEEAVRFFQSKGLQYDGKDVCDAGCGTGHLLKYVQDHFKPKSLKGFDYGDSTLKVARQVLPQVSFSTLDLHEGCNEQFDIVFCTEVVEHLLYPDKGVQNLGKMIRSGGALLLTVPNGRLDTYDGHINFWSPTSWEVFLKQNLPDFQVDSGVLNENTGILLYAYIRKA